MKKLCLFASALAMTCAQSLSIRLVNEVPQTVTATHFAATGKVEAMTIKAGQTAVFDIPKFTGDSTIVLSAPLPQATAPELSILN